MSTFNETPLNNQKRLPRLKNSKRGRSLNKDLSRASLIESARIRRSRSKIRKDWNKIFTESNLRLIQVMKSRKNTNKTFDNKKGWKTADPDSILKTEIEEEPIPKEIEELKKSIEIEEQAELLNPIKKSKTFSNLQNKVKPKKFFSPEKSDEKKIEMDNLTSLYDEIERQRCKEILKMLETRALSKHVVKSTKEEKIEKGGKIRIPRLINAGRRREFGQSTKLQAEKKLSQIDNNVDSNSSFIQKLMRKLQYKSLESIDLDWKIREKLLEFERVREEVHRLDNWKKRQQTGGLYLR